METEQRTPLKILFLAETDQHHFFVGCDQKRKDSRRYVEISMSSSMIIKETARYLVIGTWSLVLERKKYK